MNKCRAYICNLEDFDDINEIHKSRKVIRGTAKTPEYNEYFLDNIPKILNGEIQNFNIIGARDIETNKLLTYTVNLFSLSSKFIFIHFGETIPHNNVFNFKDYGKVEISKLRVDLGLKENIFDHFVSVKLGAILPVIAEVRKVQPYFDFRIHSILQPDQEPRTLIEKKLSSSANNTLPRNTPLAIIHASMLPQYRMKYLNVHQ
jgi:hypothetical protein